MSFRHSVRSGQIKGFTLTEVLVVMAIILVLTALVLPAYRQAQVVTRTDVAISTMKNLTIAMEGYRADFGEYPPDDIDGSAMIAKYLCKRLHPMVKLQDGRVVESSAHCGPYFSSPADQLKSSDATGEKGFLSPLGNRYTYVVIEDSDKQGRNYLLIDPGRDKMLGGTTSKRAGFTRTSAAAEDNIFSSVQNTQTTQTYALGILKLSIR